MVSLGVEALLVALGERRVLDGVSARFEAGALVGIVGPNGAGKSTLVRALLGLAPTARGSVTLDDRPLAQFSPRDIARRIAYLPQGQTLHWPLSVERLVALGRLPHLGPLSRVSDADRQLVAEAMVRADVSHLAARIATELSGGERARVMLARALAVGAEGLIADEPLAALDPSHQIDVMDLLAGEAQAGKLVIAVLHDLTMAARYCDRLILIDRGRIVADGTPLEVLNPERLKSVYGIDALIDASGARPMVVPLGRA